MRRLSYAVVGLAMAALITSGHRVACGGVLASSTFDSDTEGWQVQSQYLPFGNPPTLENLYAMSWRATGGNAGGYAVGKDDDWTMFFAAPEKFLGNKVAAYGGSLSYDLKEDSSGTWNSGDPSLILVGADMTLYHDPVLHPSTNWTNYTIGLTSASDWHLNSDTGSIPTESEMKEVLSSLDSMYIFTDWVYGYDTVGIDNVVMTAVPEPSTFVIFLGVSAIGLIAYTWRKRRIA
jgi:alkaline phosphatase D